MVFFLYNSTIEVAGSQARGIIQRERLRTKASCMAAAVIVAAAAAAANNNNTRSSAILPDVVHGGLKSIMHFEFARCHQLRAAGAAAERRQRWRRQAGRSLLGVYLTSNGDHHVGQLGRFELAALGRVSAASMPFGWVARARATQRNAPEQGRYRHKD